MIWNQLWGNILNVSSFNMYSFIWKAENQFCPLLIHSSEAHENWDPVRPKPGAGRLIHSCDGTQEREPSVLPTRGTLVGTWKWEQSWGIYPGCLMYVQTSQAVSYYPKCALQAVFHTLCNCGYILFSLTLIFSPIVCNWGCFQFKIKI